MDETTGFAFEDVQFQVLEVPGHTRDHIAYYFKDEKYPILFCADSLFSLGCGKLFEGSPSEMTDSLKKYLQLPKETLVYCGHEYTRSNAKFAMHILPNNPHLKKKMEELKDRHKACTIPSTLGQEFLMNPFLRLHTDEVRSALGFTPEEDDFEVFARLRSMKDRF